MQRQRIALLAVAAVIVVAGAIVAVSVGSGGDEQTTTAAPAPETTARGATTQAAERPALEVTEIRLKDGEPVGGRERIQVTAGEPVGIDVTSDVADEIHLHGYDIERPVAAGGTARFRFTADDEGIFEIESHESEHHGKDPLIAELEVQPG